MARNYLEILLNIADGIFLLPRVVLFFMAMGKLLHIYMNLLKNIDNPKIKHYEIIVSLDLS